MPGARNGLGDDDASIAPKSGMSQSRFDTDYHEVLLTWAKAWPKAIAESVIQAISGFED